MGEQLSLLIPGLAFVFHTTRTHSEDSLFIVGLMVLASIQILILVWLRLVN